MVPAELVQSQAGVTQHTSTRSTAETPPPPRGTRQEPTVRALRFSAPTAHAVGRPRPARRRRRATAPVRQAEGEGHPRHHGRVRGAGQRQQKERDEREPIAETRHRCRPPQGAQPPAERCVLNERSPRIDRDVGLSNTSGRRLRSAVLQPEIGQTRPQPPAPRRCFLRPGPTGRDPRALGGGGSGRWPSRCYFEILGPSFTLRTRGRSLEFRVGCWDLSNVQVGYIQLLPRLICSPPGGLANAKRVERELPLALAPRSCTLQPRSVVS